MRGPQRDSYQPFLLPTVNPACPAGEPVALTPTGSGCRCRIEDHVVTTGLEPSALTSYCLGHYEACPTWRADREMYWLEKSNRDLLGRDGDLRIGHSEDAPDPEGFLGG